MDFQTIIRMALEECFSDLRKALDGLTPAERRFQPHSEANHIDFLVWHMARVEDSWVHSFAQHTPLIWQREAWHKKLGLPEEDSGFGYTAAQVATLPHFSFVDLLAYFAAVRQETIQYLEGLTAVDIARRPDPERRPGYTIGKMWSHLMVEEGQHTGQVVYLRGLQRGLSR